MYAKPRCQYALLVHYHPSKAYVSGLTAPAKQPRHNRNRPFAYDWFVATRVARRELPYLEAVTPSGGT
jgi:hypothetical protein